MLDDALYEDLQRHAEAGDELLLHSEPLRAVARELSAGRELRVREQQLVAALKSVEYGAVGRTSTAPACPACRSAFGMGHFADCLVGTALKASATSAGGESTAPGVASTRA